MPSVVRASTPPTVTDASPGPFSLDVKADFPIFARRFDGRSLIYLDSGATSQKPAVVIDALSEHLRAHNANVHRGVYALAQEADAAYDGARRRVAAFVGADRSSGIGGTAADGHTPRRGGSGTQRAALGRAVCPGGQTTVFTKNVTEAINLVAYAWGRANVGPGDAVLITQLEHHANIVPWQVLCRERGAELRYLEVDARGELSLDQLDAELARGDVKLVAVVARVERARHDHAGRGYDCPHPRGGCGLAGGRRPGRAAHARRCNGDRRGLLRLDGTQGARARRGSACCTDARRSWSRWNLS